MGYEESDVDYLFEAPVELAKALTGFRHDQTLAAGVEARFEKLQPLERRWSWSALWRR